ncbi:MAG: hemolysin family protein, partial [Candidatus Pacebacteria bacterium]|nr:hemolysin family protein [Candidatus Paceibacterota bacterium]
MSATAVIVLLNILGLSVLTLLSAFFSSSETALFALSRTQAKRMSEGGRGERAAAKLLRQPQRVLSTSVVGNMIVNVLLASMIAALAQAVFGKSGVGVAICASTVLLLIFGEVTPKTIAVQHPEGLSRFIALPLLYIGTVLMPVRLVVRLITNVLLALLGQHAMSAWGVLTRDKIAALLELGEAEGAATGTERTLVENILRLGTLEAHDIMVPRTEVVGVEDSMTVREAFAVARKARHSRLPVYHEDLDDIWGVFSVIDVSPNLDETRLAAPLWTLRAEVVVETAHDMPPVYPAHVFPETAKVEGLLHDMRGRRATMALLVDEYGGTAGILTLDDILAEVVGQITPAGKARKAGVEFGDGYVLVDGRAHVREFFEVLDVPPPENGADTIGGYVTELLGRLPRAGDAAEDDVFRFHVIKMAGRCVGTLRVEQRKERQEYP